MSKGLIAIVDLGHENCQMIKEDVEDLGVDAVVCSHDLTKEQLEALGQVDGIILNGGPAKQENGFRIEASEDIYESNIPIYAVDHASHMGVDLFTWPKEKEDREEKLKRFLKKKCGLNL